MPNQAKPGLRLERPATLDFRPLKAAIQRLLPDGNALRTAILQEPDSLPAAVGQEKLETYLRLALALRGSPP